MTSGATQRSALTSKQDKTSKADRRGEAKQEEVSFCYLLVHEDFDGGGGTMGNLTFAVYPLLTVMSYTEANST